MELEAIAAVVIGGMLLTGGTGYLFGSVVGVLVLGVIKALINFQKHAELLVDENRHRTPVFAFILLQRMVFRRRRT